MSSIKLKSTNLLQLKRCVHFLRSSKVISNKIVRLPTKRRYITVNRSPHVNKQSREQFIQKTHIWCCIKISNSSLDTIIKENRHFFQKEVPAVFVS